MASFTRLGSLLRASYSHVLHLASPCSRRRSTSNIISSASPFFPVRATFCSSRTSLHPEASNSSENGDENVVMIDRSNLCTPPEHSHDGALDLEETAMAKHIKSIIKFRDGPITVAEYMEEVLTNPSAGFYMNRDVFGAAGDFITTPDVSQMFGELVGVWSMCLWEQMGQPKDVNLVELGPGRGTLMADLLRGTAKFKDFAQSISVHLVECSPTLREIQKQTLRCTSAYDKNSSSVGDDAAKEKKGSSSGDAKVCSVVKSATSELSGARISWHIDLEQVPRGVPTIIVAHEFFDALPIHQFQKTERGWCEKLVDVDDSGKGLRFVLSQGPTAASKLYLAKRFKWASVEEKAKLHHVEVCPQALKIIQEIARRVGDDGGGALVIDYGEDATVSDSLQAISKHKFTHVLDKPGTMDLSAYVDFAALKNMVKESAVGASAFGPISQSQFLGLLGINFRVEALLKNATEEQAEALQMAYWKMVGDGVAPWWEGQDELAPIGIGSRYKVLAIMKTSLGAPVCFQQS